MKALKNATFNNGTHVTKHQLLLFVDASPRPVAVQFPYTASREYHHTGGARVSRSARRNVSHSTSCKYRYTPQVRIGCRANCWSSSLARHTIPSSLGTKARRPPLLAPFPVSADGPLPPPPKGGNSHYQPARPGERGRGRRVQSFRPLGNAAKCV